MTASQAAALQSKINKIEAKIAECPADQVFVRVASQESDDAGSITYQFEARIENPDDGYTSDWSWVDACTISRRGKVN